MHHAAVAGDPSHDFDFIIGRWRIHNRRLVGRLEGSTTWEEFEAEGRAQPVLGGHGNIDEFLAPAWKPGFAGLTLRTYDPALQRWSLYWVDNGLGLLQPPVVGRFQDGVGVFEGPDVLRGRPIVVRYVWSHIAAGAARWEQFFSPDDGRTWESNWVMKFERIA